MAERATDARADACTTRSKDDSPEQHHEFASSKGAREDIDGPEQADTDALVQRLARCQMQTAGTDLDLSNLSLRDFPLEVLTKFPALKRLNVRKNKLTELPVELARQMPHLTTLNASENELSELPEQIGGLRNLQKLLLENNHLTQLPASVAKLHALEELNVRSNKLAALDDDLGNHLPKLQILLLGGNPHLRAIPHSFGNLVALRVVDLNGNGELESVPERVRRLHERNVILHSRTKRRELISRALRVRSTVAQTLSTSALVGK